MTILFEHDDFILAVKPHDLSFHSESGAGFAVQVSQQLGYDLFPVHRLDKMTSGLIILARSSGAAAVFTAMFAKHEIEKYYIAISLRKPKKKQGWIKADMAKARRGDWKLLPTIENPAITRFISAPLQEGERAFLIKPYTGKTHQIRVALKSLGSPIAGDERYALKRDALKEDRGYLHAYALKFTFAGETFTFVLPPLEGKRFESCECMDLLKTWQKPWERFRTK